jgi:four helix bundle protein
MPQPTYKNLKAWTEASDLVAATYSLCAKHKRHIDRKLAEQIRSAAVSIPSNIAEGSGRGTQKRRPSLSVHRTGLP